jgi:hypothetical protein
MTFWVVKPGLRARDVGDFGARLDHIPPVYHDPGL